MADEKILLIEDEPDILMATETVLERAGYKVKGNDRGDEALEAFYSFRPDLALLDLDLPGMSGLSICSRIREMSDIPVIMFTGSADVEGKVEAFATGADDYIVKGTDMKELVARVGAALRRSGTSSAADPEEQYSDDSLSIDFARQRVCVGGEEVALTRTEYEILTMLVQNEGRPVTPRQLLHRIWGPEYIADDLVKWHIGKLRKKIEADPEKPQLVIMRRGFGYVYSRPAR